MQFIFDKPDISLPGFGPECDFTPGATSLPSPFLTALHAEICLNRRRRRAEGSRALLPCSFTGRLCLAFAFLGGIQIRSRITASIPLTWRRSGKLFFIHQSRCSAFLYGLLPVPGCDVPLLPWKPVPCCVGPGASRNVVRNMNLRKEAFLCISSPLPNGENTAYAFALTSDR